MSPMVRFCTPLEFRLSGETGPARPIERNHGSRQVVFLIPVKKIRIELESLVLKRILTFSFITLKKRAERR